MANREIGLLLMAYGSPDHIEDLGAYLLDIRGGRATSNSLVEEIKDRYLQIGGRSPLLDLTNAQAAALQAEMDRRHAPRNIRFRAYTGMRHWEPRIHQALRQMVADGIRQAVALVMAPHSSRLSTGAYYAKLDEALNDLQAPITFQRIAGWHNHPGLIQSLTLNVVAALQRFAPQQPYVLFTAHSLPQHILRDGDPYDFQLRETATLLAQSLALPAGRWEFCFQSAGQSGEVWLGPAIEEVVVRLAHSGEKNILVVPIGFVCDHVEILYDIDIAARQLAEAHGARLERCQSLNTTPAFITALADLVQERLPRIFDKLDDEPIAASLNS